MIGTALSKNGATIRLTEERWFHIVENHDDMAGLSHDVLETIQSPDMIVKGLAGELLAVRRGFGTIFIISSIIRLTIPASLHLYWLGTNINLQN